MSMQTSCISDVRLDTRNLFQVSCQFNLLDGPFRVQYPLTTKTQQTSLVEDLGFVVDFQDTVDAGR